MHLICKTCQSVLSNDLTPVIYATRSEVWGENMVASGTVTTEDGSYFLNQAGSCIIHTDDVKTQSSRPIQSSSTAAVGWMALMAQISRAGFVACLLPPK